MLFNTYLEILGLKIYSDFNFKTGLYQEGNSRTWF